MYVAHVCMCIIIYTHALHWSLEESSQHSTSLHCPDTLLGTWWNDADDYRGRVSQGGIHDAVGKERDRCTHGFFRVSKNTGFQFQYVFECLIMTFSDFYPVGSSWSSSTSDFTDPSCVATFQHFSTAMSRWARWPCQEPGPCSWAMTCADSKDIGYVKYNSFICKR
jgi:hypothetical protein